MTKEKGDRTRENDCVNEKEGKRQEKREKESV